MLKKSFGLVMSVLFIAFLMFGCGNHSSELLNQISTNKLSQLSVLPSYVSLSIGGTYQFRATGYVAGNATAMLLSPSWEVTGNVGTISASGVFSATKAGSGKVIGRYGSMEGSADVVVDNVSTQEIIVDTTPPPAPKNLSGMGYSTMACLQWDAVLVSDLYRYKIYRCSSRDGEYIEIGLTSITHYQDNDLEMGQEYFYKIKAIDTSSYTSDFSDCLVIRTVNYNFPLPPQGLSASFTNQSISLNWDRNNENDLNGYNIYRRDVTNDEMGYSKINNTIIKSLNFHDPSSITAHLYKYVITAVNTSNMESYNSNPVEIMALPAGVTNEPPQITLSASSAGISPNNDGIKDSIEIRYSITDDHSTKGRELNIVIWGPDMSKKTIVCRPNESLPFSGSFAWDGRDDNGKIFPEGNAGLAVSMYDDTNKISSQGIDLTVDTIKPKIQSITQNLYVFSPNGDGKYDLLDVTFAASEDNTATIALTKDNIPILTDNLDVSIHKDNKCAIYKDKVVIYKRDPRNGNFIADKTFNLQNGLVDGSYTFSVYTTDIGGNISDVKAVTFESDTTRPRITSLIKDGLTFSWTLSEPSYVTLKIVKMDGTLFRSNEGATAKFSYPTAQIPNHGPDTGQFVWDGKGSRNESISEDYQYYLEVEDNVGNRTSSDPITVVFRSPFLLSYLYMSPDPFSPVNPLNNFTEVRYELGNDGSTVYVSVEAGSTIKTLVNGETQNAGVHSVKWYGDYDPGYGGSTAAADHTKVSDGSYMVSISVSHPDAARPATTTNTVRVDNVPPQIMVQSLLTDNATKKASVVYSIPENCTVTIEVHDSNENVVATPIASTIQYAGGNTVEWSGAQGGNTYHFKIIVIDRALNKSEKETGTFSF